MARHASGSGLPSPSPELRRSRRGDRVLTRHFPTTSKTSWAGFPALKSPSNVLLLFTKVAAPPPTQPQTAIWHFGWHAVDSRKSLETFKSRPDVKLLPLYTSDEGGSVFISSDTWPGTGGVLGLTKAQIVDAKAKGVQPSRDAGFGYMEGPDGAIIEFLGRFPAERFNHVHMFQEDPFCAQLWYQKHLNAPIYQGRTSSTPLTEADCKVPRGPDPTWPALEQEGLFRTPSAAVEFDDVALTWYARQDEQPLVGTRGHLRTTSGSASPISTPGSPSCAARASNFSNSPIGSAIRVP